MARYVFITSTLQSWKEKGNQKFDHSGTVIFAISMSPIVSIKVRLDGQDIRFLDRRWFRRQIGIVHKKPEFFKTSIADNIAYGKADSTLKEIVRAAKDAGAHEFILDLPKVGGQFLKQMVKEFFYGLGYE